MFQIAHDGLFVYSLIEIREIKGPSLKEETIEELMFLWANKTAIPYIEFVTINHLQTIKMFKPDDITWYLK